MAREVEALCQTLQDLGEDGALKGHEPDSFEHAKMLELASSSWSKLSYGTVRAATTFLEGWRAFAKNHRFLWSRPLPVHTAVWIQLAERNGPTAARGRFAAAKWLAANLGMALHVDVKLVADQAIVSPCHMETQASP